MNRATPDKCQLFHEVPALAARDQATRIVQRCEPSIWCFKVLCFVFWTTTQCIQSTSLRLNTAVSVSWSAQREVTNVVGREEWEVFQWICITCGKPIYHEVQWLCLVSLWHITAGDRSSLNVQYKKEPSPAILCHRWISYSINKMPQAEIVLHTCTRESTSL